MAELLDNTTFEADADSWNVSNAAQDPENGYETVGCLELTPNGGAASAYQDVTTPAITGETSYGARLALAIRMPADTKPAKSLLIEILNTGETETYFEHEEDGASYPVQEWFVLSFDMILATDTAHRVKFSVEAGAATWQIDDLSLDLSALTAHTKDWFVWELRKLRHDLAGMKRPKKRYREIVNQAIREVPESMWRREIDTSITTSAETRRYSLASITEITRPRQLKRVWMEDGDGHDFQIGLWHVEDDDGTLNLVLKRDPPEAGRTLRLQYTIPWDELDTPKDPTDTTTLDPQWILAKGMTLLLAEAGWDMEDPEYIQAQQQVWAAKLYELERRLVRRSEPGRVRSTDWRRWR